MANPVEGVLDRRDAIAHAQKPIGSFDLTGEIAVVTGAKGRLGSIWIQALQHAGATVYGTDTPAMELGNSIFACDAKDGIDLTKSEDVDRLLGRVRSLGGEPTILVNNAGVDSRPSDTDDPTARMCAVNLLGTDRMLRVFGEAMAKRGKGSIINIASLYGLVVPDLRYYDHRADGWVKDAMYPATKAGVIQLTRYYAAKYAARGVRVNALAPGGVVSDTDALTASDPEFARKYTARIPMGRMCTPADLAGPLVFLASQASAFMTGQTIALDGGYTCW